VKEGRFPDRGQLVEMERDLLDQVMRPVTGAQ